MSLSFDDTLTQLKAAGNLRTIPADTSESGLVDLSQNDYLGLADNTALRSDFMADAAGGEIPLTASASRLLASHQREYAALEALLEEAYGHPALLFNSGYHANVGLVSALAREDTVVIADKLIHASIIDGIKMSGAAFERFRHNDLSHLERLIAKHSDVGRILLIVESIYSMDGDSADLGALAAIKRRHPGIMLYVDEAHAVGVKGPQGLGLAQSIPEVDIIVGTFGKALASAGAYCICSPTLKEYLTNHARSLIFSTALPPISAAWSRLTFATSLTMDDERRRLERLARLLARATGSTTASHIQPLITGSSAVAVELSRQLLEEGFKVLPIRVPTVPPGTERLRFSLSATIAESDLERLVTVIKKLTTPCKA